MRGWRFYDSFRVDPDAPARQPQVGTRTEVLAGDGHDLAATVATHSRIGLGRAAQAAVADAFDGSGVAVADHDGRFEVALTQRGLLRPLSARAPSGLSSGVSGSIGSV